VARTRRRSPRVSRLKADRTAKFSDAGPEFGEQEVCGDAQGETRLPSRGGIRATTSWLLVSVRSSLATAGDVAAPSQMGQSVDVGRAVLQLVRLDSFVVAERRARNCGDALGSTCRTPVPARRG
jgi:hypothetical protein